MDQSKEATTGSPLNLSSKTKTMRSVLVKKIKLTSSFQMAAGSATSAKTTISRAERSVTDARRPRPMRTKMGNQSICSSQRSAQTRRNQRLWRSRSWKRSLATMKTARLLSTPQKLRVQRDHQSVLETGPVNSASTTTSLSETFAICATWVRLRAWLCSNIPNSRDSKSLKPFSIRTRSTSKE